MRFFRGLAALISVAAAGPAAATNVTLNATLVSSCTLTLSTPGTMTASTDGTLLGSEQSGGSAASMTLVAIGTLPTITFAAPSLTTGRPMVLPALYGTFAGLQIYDGYSTVKGIRRGAREGNAIVGGLAGNPAAFWTLKAASTGVSIYFAERLWRNGRRGQAIAVMVASSAAMSVVAARNASVLKTTR